MAFIVCAQAQKVERKQGEQAMNKNRLAITILALAITALLGLPLQAANILTNPGFEGGYMGAAPAVTPNGWTLTSGTGACGYFAVSPGNGVGGTYAAQFGDDCFADFDQISQTVTTVVGQSYMFSFWLNASQVTGTQGEFLAYLNGNPTLDLVGPNAGYQYYETDFVAVGTSTTIAFAGDNALQSTYLDNATVAPIPEPSAWMLGLGGLAGLLSLRKRR